MLIDQALSLLRDRAQVELSTNPPTTHCVRVVKGFEDDECVEALALYVVGCLAQSFNSNLEIIRELSPATLETIQPTLASDAQRILGVSNDDPEIDRVHSRDPWLAEAVMHLLVQLCSGGVDSFNPVPVHAKTPLTVAVRRPGVDLFTVCGPASGIEFAIGEGKSTEQDVTGAISEAVGLFRSVERGERDLEVRTLAASLASSLSPSMRESLYMVLWTPSYVFHSVVVHGNVTFDPAANRQSISNNLVSPAASIFVCVLAMNDYRSFFDQLADAVRARIEAPGDV